MSHEEIKESISAFHDGELSQEKRLEIEAHLKTCADCRHALEAWREVARTFFKQTPVEPSPDFVLKVMGRLKDFEEPSQPRRDGTFPRWLVPAMGLGFAALFFFLAVPEQEIAVSTEILLLADGREGSVSEPDFFADPMEKEDILEYALEEP